MGEISAQIYFPIICLYMHTLLCGKKTPDHKSPDHKQSKKDKRNKKRETQLQNKKNGGSKNEKVVKCRIKQRGK